MLHHVSLKTADIHRAIAFYGLLDFAIAERFTTGHTLACWLTGRGSCLELIQVPQPAPGGDPFGDEHYVGYYHLSFDVTTEAPDLPQWWQRFQEKAQGYGDRYGAISLLLPPQQQMIGRSVYEVLFFADGDGQPIEILRRCTGPESPRVQEKAEV